MVLADSHGISRVPRYSGTCRESAGCRLRGSHPLWPIVPDRSTNLLVGNSLVLHQTGPTTPPCKHDGLGYVRVRSPLLAESLLFSFPPGTEMVHFPGFAPTPYVFRWRYLGSAQVGSPIRKSAGHRMLAPHRSLSQLATSFIASKCQGIHRLPLVA